MIRYDAADYLRLLAAPMLQLLLSHLRAAARLPRLMILPAPMSLLTRR